MWRHLTTLHALHWRRVARRLYRTMLPLSVRHGLVRVLALRLPGMRGMRVGRVARLALVDFFVDDMGTYAAALAFHLLLALFPFIIFLLTLLTVMHMPGFLDWLLSQGRDALPAQARGPLGQALRQVRLHQSQHGGLLSAGIIGALWASSAGMRSVMNAINVAYDIAESRPFWQRYALSVAFTLGLTALLIAATALLVLGPPELAHLAAHLHGGLDRVILGVWGWLRLPCALLLLMLAVALIYNVAPNCSQPFHLLTPGAVVAVVGWLSATLLFSAYTATVGHYNATYGSIAAIVVLLLYFYLSALALLLGAEINSVIEQSSPEERATVPAGADGAVPRPVVAGRGPRA